MSNRKVYLHRDARYLAINLKTMNAWEFIPLTTKGQVFKTYKTVIGYEPTFKSAITAVRKNGDKVPASGWETHRFDKSLHKSVKQLAPYVWGRDPESVDVNPTKQALKYLVKNNPFREKTSDEQFRVLLVEYGKSKGKEALQAMAGFHVYCTTVTDERITDEKEQLKAIRTTLAHDLKGRNDEYMEPRTTNYLTHWEEYLDQ